MFLILLLKLAFADSAGLGVGTIAIRSSSGNHRQHLGVNVWKKSCSAETADKLESCIHYGLGLGQNIQLVPNGTMKSRVVQSKILYGVQMGVLPLKVGFSIGVGVNGIIGGVETLIWKVQPGVMGAVELERALGNDAKKDWLARFEANQLIYGFGSHYGMVLGVSKKW